MSNQNWRILGASVTGTSHLSNSKAGQDRFLAETVSVEGLGKVVVMVVADGAGSAERSWAGSWMACHGLMQAVKQALAGKAGQKLLMDCDPLNSGLFRSLFRTTRRRIFAWSRALNCPVSSLATTINLMILHSSGGLMAQVGDGLIGYQSAASTKWNLNQIPQLGEFVGETTFLTSSDWESQLTIGLIGSPVHRAVMSTDGLLPILYQSQSHQIHSPFLDPLFEVFEKQPLTCSEKELQLRAFLQGPRVATRCDDDLTLLLATSFQYEVDERANQS